MKIGFTVDTNILQGRDGRSTNLEKNLSFFLDYIKAITKKDKVNSLTNVIFVIPDLNDYFDSIRKMSNLAYGITNEPFKNVKGIIGAITTSEIINSTLESVNKYNESLKQVTEGLKIPKISNTFQSISEGVIDKKIIDSFKNNKIDNNNNQ